MDPHDRKVKTIYEALRANNWKGALKMSNTSLQKFADSPVILSFKAVALQKLGRSDEAFQICENIRTIGTIDSQVLHTMGMVYKALDRMKCLTMAYVKAVDMKKNDLELLGGLFSCYVRECDFMKQQQLAMKMSRATGNSEKYLWWVVVSVVLQVWNRPSTDSAPLLGVRQTLKLAHSLAKKKLDATKAFHSFEALLLYLDLLYTQGLGREAQLLLESDMTASLCKQPLDLKILQAQCFLYLRDDDKAAEALRAILRENPDHWNCCTLLLDVFLGDKTVGDGPEWQSLYQESCKLVLNMHGKPSSPLSTTERTVDIDQAEAALSFIQNNLKMTVDSGSLPAAAFERTSALIELDFVKRQQQHGLADMSAVLTVIQETFRRIGHYKSTPADLQTYISPLSHESQDTLASLLIAETTTLEAAACLDTYTYDGAITLSNGYLILSTLNAASLSSDSVSQFVQSCVELATQEVEESKVDYRDTATLAAVNFLMTKMSKHQAVNSIGLPVWKSYVLLRTACQRDEYNPHLNIAFSAVCHLLGAPQMGTETLEKLEIKHAQLDSVSSHLSFPFLRSYYWEPVLRKYALSAWQLFSSQKADVEEMTYTAYIQGTYSKVLEFVDFKERLEMSHAFYTCQSESTIPEVKQCHQSIDTVEAGILGKCTDNALTKAATDFFHKLSFNEDLSVRPCWLPPPLVDYRFSILEWWQGDVSKIRNWNRSDAEAVEKWKQCRVAWLKVRWCIPHLLKRMWLLDDVDTSGTTAIDIALEVMGMTLENCHTTLRRNFHGWKKLHPECTQLSDAYTYFQCGVFWLGHVAYDVFRGTHSEISIQDFQNAMEFVYDFCEYILTYLFHTLESDLSSWVRVAGTVFRAILSEELIFVVYGLQKWETHLNSLGEEAASLKEKLTPILGSFISRLGALIQKLRTYLGLILHMETKKVSKNVMLLMGAMTAKQGVRPFEEEIKGKDVGALSVFMQNIRLEDYEKCTVWEFFPSGDIDSIEQMIRDVFEETVCWTQDLTESAESLHVAISNLTSATSALAASE